MKNFLAQEVFFAISIDDNGYGDICNTGEKDKNYVYVQVPTDTYRYLQVPGG